MRQRLRQNEMALMVDGDSLRSAGTKRGKVRPGKAGEAEPRRPDHVTGARFRLHAQGPRLFQDHLFLVGREHVVGGHALPGLDRVLQLGLDLDLVGILLSRLEPVAQPGRGWRGRLGVLRPAPVCRRARAPV